MNWYRVLTQHDNLRKNDVVLLEGGAREAALEQIGYLRLVAVQPQEEQQAAKPKRVRRGQPGEDRPAESEPVGEVSGD
jgi:hypothetical protein